MHLHNAQMSTHTHTHTHTHTESNNPALVQGPVQVQGQAGAGVVKPRSKAEDEYLAKLQAIRRQNFLERKRIQERVQGEVAAPTPSPPPLRRPETEVEARRKKIAALKVTAHKLLLSELSICVEMSYPNCLGYRKNLRLN